MKYLIRIIIIIFILQYMYNTFWNTRKSRQKISRRRPADDRVFVSNDGRSKSNPNFTFPWSIKRRRRLSRRAAPVKCQRPRRTIFCVTFFFFFVRSLFFASPRNKTTIDNLLVKCACDGVVVSRRIAGGKERLTDGNRVIGCYGVFRMFR